MRYAAVYPYLIYPNWVVVGPNANAGGSTAKPNGWNVSNQDGAFITVQISSDCSVVSGSYEARQGGYGADASANFQVDATGEPGCPPNPEETPPPPTPTPAPTATPAPTPTATPAPNPTIELTNDRANLSAGGWDEVRQGYVYLNKQSGQVVARDQKPDPHISTLIATVKSGSGIPLAGKSVSFTWDMPGPAPEITKTATTDSNGKAQVDAVSGDELGSVTVRAKLSGEIFKSQTLTIAKPTDNWSPIEVSPDLKGDPTVRIKLTHDNLPVTGHPISWGIDKILDSKGAEVAPAKYSQYVTLSGEVSTTNAIGEAAVYLRFGTRSGTIYYSARDGVVYEKPVVADRSTQGRQSASILSRVQTKYRKELEKRSKREIEDVQVTPTRQKIDFPDGPRKLFIVHSKLTFVYEPEPDATRMGSARIEVQNEAFGEEPLIIDVPLDGDANPTASLNGKAVRLAASDFDFYKTFAKEFIKVLHDDFESGAALKRVSCVVEGYGAAAWNAGSGAVKGGLEPVVRAYHVLSNPTKALEVTINGVSFLVNNRDEIRRKVGANLAAMPAGIVKAYKTGRQEVLNARIDKLTRTAAGFAYRSWDSMVTYAALHPEDFARNSGQVAGYGSMALIAKRVSIPNVGGQVFRSKVLGKVTANAATRLVAISRNSKVLVRTTDARFRPMVQKVLTKGKVWRNGAETIAEAETDIPIAASRQSWTAKLRLKMRGDSTETQPGTPKMFCFPAGTLIQMGNGSLLPIEQVREKDEVISRDEKTQKNSVQKVTQLFRRVTKQTLHLRFSNGEQVEATPEHPFFVSGKGFRPAKMLAVGMAIATLGKPVKVEAVQALSESKTVYNFGVGDTQTYFVGKTGLWVHNQYQLRSQLKVAYTANNRYFLPRVVRRGADDAEFAFQQKISSYFKGRKIEDAPTAHPGFDGWWDTHLTGTRISLKETAKSHPKNVMTEAVRSVTKAKNAGLTRGRIETLINAPNVNAKELLDFIKPGTALDIAVPSSMAVD